jgi:hypothetical protein
MDQADDAFGPPLLLGGMRRAGDAGGCEAARHRRHDDMVGQLQGADAERAQQDINSGHHTCVLGKTV